MTNSHFSKKVIRDGGYEKYWFYIIHSATIYVGFIFLIDVISNPAKYDSHGTRVLTYFAVVLLFILRCSGFYLIPNRYKVLVIQDNLSLTEKKKVINQLLHEFGIGTVRSEDFFYSFSYQKNWWGGQYRIYVAIELDCYYLSVISSTSRGIIDLGRTERMRKEIQGFLGNA